MPSSAHLFFCLHFPLIYVTTFTDGIQLTVVNKCKESIWPGILGNAGHQTPKDSGLHHCSGTGGVPPATVVELTLGTPKSALHFYDVSLVDGFNLPVPMAPVSGGVQCGVAACEVDLNSCCPWSLAVKKEGKVVGCKSACLAAKTDRYCCTSEFANPTSCKPTVFANLFKAICPRAYSYAYDELTGLKTCRTQQFSFLWDAQVEHITTMVFGKDKNERSDMIVTTWNSSYAKQWLIRSAWECVLPSITAV
ncbi:hypothetical protein RJ639_036712 [Escallonia herrerae]|uniref:Thaumatin-like protein n=1 Tax=Escallonia herrerae TaxID=1293975 RepID=A0AA88WQ11_9ASTE|nr:hypothetical protein RJ639_036712 [Escallonia herrerae]